MAFSDYQFQIQVDKDTAEIWRWCDEHCALGTWGKLISLIGKGATYCFQYEGDAMLFLLRWPTA